MCTTQACKAHFAATNSSGQWGSFTVTHTVARNQPCMADPESGQCVPDPSFPGVLSQAAGSLVIDPSYFARDNGGAIVHGTVPVAISASGPGSMDGWYADVYEGEPGPNEQLVLRVLANVTCTECS